MTRQTLPIMALKVFYSVNTMCLFNKRFFEAVDRIRSIPTDLFDEDYRCFSFDVTSLFTNVPLNKNINIILHRIYKANLVQTNMT